MNIFPAAASHSNEVLCRDSWCIYLAIFFSSVIRYPISEVFIAIFALAESLSTRSLDTDLTVLEVEDDLEFMVRYTGVSVGWTKITLHLLIFTHLVTDTVFCI